MARVLSSMNTALADRFEFEPHSRGVGSFSQSPVPPSAAFVNDNICIRWARHSLASAHQDVFRFESSASNSLQRRYMAAFREVAFIDPGISDADAFVAP